jgi:outer membrane protein
MDRIIIISLLILSNLAANAQNDSMIVTMDEAVKQALEENPEIIVARNQRAIADNNASIAKANLLPSLTANAGYTLEVNDTYIEFAGEERPPINEAGAQASTFQANLELNYNIFNGLAKYKNHESLLIQSDITDQQTRLQVENTILQTINTFLEIVRLKEETNINEEAVETSLQRFQRVENQYDFGGVTKLQVLNARVDLNNDSINFARSLTNLANNKRNLMILMGNQPDTIFTVPTNLSINRTISLENIKQEALKNNTNLILTELRRQNADIQTVIARSNNYPRLDLSASYGYTRNENEANFFTFQENLGFSGSLNLSYNIFNGDQRARQIQNAKLQLASSKETENFAKKQVKRDVLNAYENYENSLFLLSLAEDDIYTARLNFERSEEAYQTGQINSTEYRQAQLNLVQASYRIIELKVQAKNAEVELYRLAGALLARAAQ